MGFDDKQIKEANDQLELRLGSDRDDVKLTNGEKHQFIKADLSTLRTQLDMLQSHIDYYYECIKTLDNMAFAIRNRISLDDKEF